MAQVAKVTLNSVPSSLAGFKDFFPYYRVIWNNPEIDSLVSFLEDASVLPWGHDRGNLRNIPILIAKMDAAVAYGQYLI